MAEYKVHVLNQLGTLVSTTDLVLALDVTLVTNNVHAARVTFPDAFDIDKLAEDYRLEIRRNEKPLGETQFIIQRIDRALSASGQKTITAHAAGANKILEWPIVAYNAGTSQAAKSGAADDLIKEIVDENLGASATDTDRDMSSYLGIEVDVSAGATVAKSFSRRNVLSVCQELAEASATAGTRLYFDIVFGATAYELRTYTGQRNIDRTNNVVMSPDRQNITEMSISRDYSGLVNYVYAGGQGQESDRNIQTSSNATRIGNTIWGRVKEGWRDARHATLDATLVDEADLMVRNGKERITARGRYMDTAGQAWDDYVSWGDLVKIQFATDDPSYTALVDPVSFRVRGGEEQIAVQFKIEL